MQGMMQAVILMSGFLMENKVFKRYKILVVAEAKATGPVSL